MYKINHLIYSNKIKINKQSYNSKYICYCLKIKKNKPVVQQNIYNYNKIISNKRIAI